MTVPEATWLGARLPWSPAEPGRPAPPVSVDLRGWFPPVVDQSGVPLCTAAVVTAIAGYGARRARGEDFSPSLLFNYRTSRALAGRPDRPGSTLRWSLEAWARHGMLEEDRWPFRPDLIDRDPSEESFRRAAGRRGIGYGRIDDGDCVGAHYLMSIRNALAIGLPVTLEFPLHPIQFASYRSGVMAVPPSEARFFGVHVVTVAGYDDRWSSRMAGTGRTSLPGALLIRNSWGVNWAEGGYGWLPYEYVMRGLAKESWYVIEDGWKQQVAP